MSTFVRVLILEDRPSDAELMLAELREAGFDPHWVRVDNAQDFLQQLDTPLDLILADYNLPQFDGLQALALLQERGVDIPFLIVSGSIGEERAVIAMKQGAADYVLKDRLARLGVAVSHALGEKQLRDDKRRAEKSLRESEQRFRALIENSTDAIALSAKDGTIIYASPAAGRMLGVTEQELLGRSTFDGVHPDDLVAARALYNHLLQHPGATLSGQFRLRHKDGSWRWVEGTGTNLLNEPSVRAMVANYRDITERKRAEEAYRTLVENSLQGLAILQDERIVFANPALAEMSGYAIAELLAFSPAEFLAVVHPADRPSVTELHRDWHVQELVRPRSEFRLIRRDGTVRWMEAYSSRTDYHGRPALQMAYLDITERKYAEEQLARRADEFAALYETTRDLMGQYDLAVMLQTVVERAVKLLDAAGGSIFLYDASHNELEIAVSKGPAWPVGTRFQLGEGMAGRVALDRAPLIANDYQAWEEYSLQHPEIAITAKVEVPMLYAGELIGVLSVNMTKQAGNTGENRARRFMGRDAVLLSLFAGVAASAVHNARLLQETRTRAQQLGLLYDAGLALNSVLEPREQLEFLFQIAIRALRAERAEFFRFDPTRAELTFELGIGYQLHSSIMEETRFKVGEEQGLVGWVATAQVPLNVHDVAAEPRYVMMDPAIRSGLWVAVVHENQLLGVLAVLSTRVDAFTLDDERLIALFANQAAVALENARLFEEIRRRLSELEAIARISTALRLASGLEVMIPLLLDETLAILNMEAGAIWFYDSAHQIFKKEAARGWFVALPVIMSAGEGLGRQLLNTGQLYVSKEFTTDPFTRTSIRTQIPMGWGGVGVPIRAAEEIIGALFISVQSTRELNQNEIQLLNTIAEIAGNAIHRMRLHQQTERQLQQVVALHTIDLAIDSSFDLTFNLDLILDQVTGQLHVDAADILLYNPLWKTLDYKAARGFRTKGIESTRLRLSEGNAATAFLQRRVVFNPDLSRPRIPFLRAQLLSAERFTSHIAIPLVVKGQSKGVLEVFHRSPLEPDAEWLDFLEALATQTAIAIENASLFDDLQRSNAELTLAYDKTIEGWSRALDLRDKETEGHTQRVTTKTLELARTLGIGEEECRYIRRGALLHDIGKMGIPDSILLKPGPLTDEEWTVMRKHPEYARELIAPITYLRDSLDIPFCHHEKWDGTGYPRRLKREQIPLSARIFAIVDVWDALSSERPYRQAWAAAQVSEYLSGQSGQHFDPHVVETFLKLIAVA